ncbi:MAG: asparagine synthase (glutamine-hydrolyzing) [Chloroflexota bacterium]
MCGIYGIWHRNGQAVDLLAVQRAITAMRHRGPDDEGYLLANTHEGSYILCAGDDTSPELGLPHIRDFAGSHFDLALAFRRLSILDTSPAGHQPMSLSGSGNWLVFNGEIYNYIELRAELAALGHSFHTGSDTEVILAAYRQWGSECVRRFNGMWALSLWDAGRRRLLLSRDRMGVKPLYTVAGTEGTFAFSSEIKGLLAGGVVGFRPSAGAVSRYVAEGVMPSHKHGDTFFEGVQQLPGGYSALITPDERMAHPYWSLPHEQSVRDAQPPASEADEIAQYAGLFTDSVRLRLRADVPVGTCLSGGLDSSAIVAVAGRLMQTEHAVSLERLGDHQQTFSAVYNTSGPWNERPYIDQVVGYTGAAANFVYPTEDRLWDDLARLVWHQDEPFQSTSIFAQWCVMGLARERAVTVLLDGQGADELLGGYRPFAVWLGQLLRAGRVSQALRESASIEEVTGLNPLPLLARGLAQQLPSAVLRRLRRSRMQRALHSSGLSSDLGVEFAAAMAHTGDGYAGLRDLDTHLSRLLLEDSLPTLLRYEDRNSMAFSIEARVPFLDYRLIEHVFTSASHLRIKYGWTKWIQRQAVSTLLPHDIVWRRDKVGFETPEQQWFHAGKTQLLAILQSDTQAADYLDMSYVRREAPRLIDAGDTAQVWRWLNLTLWLRQFKRATGDVAAA